jgi:hypothetical protein
LTLLSLPNAFGRLSGGATRSREKFGALQRLHARVRGARHRRALMGELRPPPPAKQVWGAAPPPVSFGRRAQASEPRPPCPSLRANGAALGTPRPDRRARTAVSPARGAKEGRRKKQAKKISWADSRGRNQEHPQKAHDTNKWPPSPFFTYVPQVASKAGGD